MEARTQKFLRGTLFGACVVALVSVASCGKSTQSVLSRPFEAWDATNRPQILGDSYVTTFSDLPMQGSTLVEPWSDSYWPNYEGGIAARWNADGTSLAEAGDSWHYELASRQALESMTLRERAALSPAEKFDILSGRYDYPLVKFERDRNAPTNETWWGICHGWAPAAFNYLEPKPVTVKNADGIEIPFGASDVKALLSFQQSRSGRSAILGQRCNADIEANPLAANSLECRDVNPGSFHIVVANQLGLLRQPFVMDVTRDVQVWNQPVYSFVSRQVSTRRPHFGAAPGTVREIEMATDVVYIVEKNPSWDTHVGTDNARTRERYAYFIELDALGRIIGGSWISKVRPDFLWTIEKADLTGFFAPLRSLYETSVGVTPDPVVTPPQTSTPAPTPVATLVPAVFDPRCPQGAAFDESIGYCVIKREGESNLAIGNFTKAMADLCEVNAGGQPCREEKPFLLADGRLVFLQQWNYDFAKSLRGSGVCALGAQPDAAYGGFCVEGEILVNGQVKKNAHGPFPEELIARCNASGGGAACLTLRWDANFLKSLL